MKSHQLPSVRALLGMSLLALVPSLSLWSQTCEKPASGKQHFSQRIRGQEALTTAPTHLADCAKVNELDEPALRSLIQKNHDLWLDREGKIFYACEGLKLTPGSPEAAAAEVAAAQSQPTAVLPNSPDAFKLHSLPGANRVIYLDFTGHTTSGTAWNTSNTNGADIVSAPFDMDGDPTTFSTAERDRITKIWQRVSEDYMPFLIDVTTEDPGIEALRRTSSTDQAYGVRVVISPTSAWFPGAGGVAFVGSFNWNSDTPAFVFSNNLGPNSEKAIAEASSHEAGHTLGLSHDGVVNGPAYYAGQGNWAPIMGVSYNKPISQWSKGEYPGANNTEDDLAVMQKFGAVPVADDHGDTMATATVVKGPTVNVLGMIGTRTDVDMFRLDVGAGTIALNIAGTSPQPNCDLKADLLDSAGNVILSNDPAGLATSINKAVTAGTYYLRLDGVGSGDPTTTGYSDYASLGEYLITGTIPTGGTPPPPPPPAPNVPPVAKVSATPTTGTAPLVVKFSSAGSTDSDGTIVSQSWAFGDGATSTDANPSHTYTTAGTFAAVLTVTDDEGAKNSATVSIVVSPAPTGNQPPVAKATATPTSGPAPLTVKFSSLGSSDSDGTIASQSWNFGDTQTSTEANPSHIYTAAGTYSAVLTVTDSAGAKATSTVSIVVSAPPAGNQPPVAKASATPTSGTAPLTVKFSSAGSADAEGPLASTSWNFGDNTPVSTEANPSHVYTAPGTYSAVLTVTDSAGAKATSSVSIVVSAVPPAGGEAVDVSSFTLTPRRNSNGTKLVAAARVLDQANKPVAGVRLSLQWSGVFVGTLHLTTDSNGEVRFATHRTTFPGAQTVTITKVTPPSGITYNPSLFAQPLTRTVSINQ